MKRIILALLIVAVTLIMPIIVSASDTSLANYEATVTISNNSTATTNVCVPFTLNSTALIAAGYIDTACTRVAVTDSTDTYFMPGYNGNPWVVFVPSIGADATVRDSLFTANTSLSSTKTYFPAPTAGLVIGDNATLEFGADFSFDIYAYFDFTAIGSRIYYKNSAFYVDISGTDNITVFSSAAGTPHFHANGFTSGWHYLKVYTTAGNVTALYDNVFKGTISLGGTSIPNQTYDHEIGQNGCPMPMIQSANITIGGVLKGSWDWEYGAYFYDNTGNGYTATPSFRTTSSDADVSATISSFIALDTATAPSYTVTEQGTFYTGNITATGNFTSSGRPGTGPAVLEVVDDVATAGDVPSPFLWGIIGCFTFASSGLALSYAHKKFAIGGGYVFIMLIVGIIIFGLLIAFKIFDWWMLWFYLIIAGGIAMASRHIDWGGSTSQHSLIGYFELVKNKYVWNKADISLDEYYFGKITLITRTD